MRNAFSKKCENHEAALGPDFAIYNFVQELYKKRRVSERTYKRVNGFLGNSGTVELVGILGYYTLVAMMLDAFNVPLPEGATPAFAEK